MRRNGVTRFDTIPIAANLPGRMAYPEGTTVHRRRRSFWGVYFGAATYQNWIFTWTEKDMKARTLLLTLALCFVGVAVSFADNPNMGTWKLNEAKSKIPPGFVKNTTVAVSYTHLDVYKRQAIDPTEGTKTKMAAD